MLLVQLSFTYIFKLFHFYRFMMTSWHYCLHFLIYIHRSNILVYVFRFLTHIFNDGYHLYNYRWSGRLLEKSSKHTNKKLIAKMAQICIFFNMISFTTIAHITSLAYYHTRHSRSLWWSYSGKSFICWHPWLQKVSINLYNKFPMAHKWCV